MRKSDHGDLRQKRHIYPTQIMAKDYILGTDQEELDRLGFQHRVWSVDAFSVWNKAGLGLGQRILDLGCGPGFATFDLATIAGPNGSVLGVDWSPDYIAYASRQAEVRGVSNVAFKQSSVLELDLEPGSFDAIYCRWLLSWIKEVPQVIQNIARLLKPGGKFIAQEYSFWGTFRIEPERPEVRAIIEACRESWRVMDSEIDIGPELPGMMTDAGMRVDHMAPLAKISQPGKMVWQWPTTFLHIYSHKLIEMGLLTTAERDAFVAIWPEMEANPGALIQTPLMMEVVGTKL